MFTHRLERSIAEAVLRSLYQKILDEIISNALVALISDGYVTNCHDIGLGQLCLLLGSGAV